MEVDCCWIDEGIRAEDEEGVEEDGMVGMMEA